MPTLRLELPIRPSDAEIASLRADLAPCAASAYELPSQSMDLREIALAVSFASDALQGVDVLVHWLKAWLPRAPGSNQARIRLSDGRTLELEATADPDAFVETLRAALIKM